MDYKTKTFDDDVDGENSVATIQKNTASIGNNKVVKEEERERKVGLL